MEKVFQVREFNEFVSIYLGEIGEVVVEGEISQLRLQNQRWLFLTLKDEAASLPVFGIQARLSNLGALAEGMLVRVHGRPRLYQKTASFSLWAEKIVPAGAGALQLAFERLRRQLESEGLFAEERKRALPRYPRRIGLVTAAGSRAYSDFVKILAERLGGLKIYFYPVAVQGEGAVESILEALETLNRHYRNLDLLVITRGGGSLEDLQAFNDERLVRAVFASQIPVVCAVGHEADVSLAELAADLRASTPSNAAELIAPSRRELLAEAGRLELSLQRQLETRLQSAWQQWHGLEQRLERSLDGQLAARRQFLQRLDQQLKHYRQKLLDKREEVGERRDRLQQAIGRLWQNDWRRWQRLRQLLLAFDHRRVLRRGFSLTYNQKGELLRSVAALAKGEELVTVLADGRARSQVKEVDYEEQK